MHKLLPGNVRISNKLFIYFWTLFKQHFKHFEEHCDTNFISKFMQVYAASLIKLPVIRSQNHATMKYPGTNENFARFTSFY